MREFLMNILDDNVGGLEITLFSPWHIGYLLLIVGLATMGIFLLKNKDEKQKRGTLNVLAIVIITLYVVDFFIQPLYSSDNNMIVDKLPFHICTLMAVLVPFAQFNKKFEKFKTTVVVLSLVSSIMYLCYPGSALGGVSPFSYRVLQTFVFHGLLFTWSLLNITTGEVKLNFKHLWQELCALIVIALWATIGNNVYSTEEHPYDWFFITGRTFPFVPSALMPFVVIGLIFALVVAIYLIDFAVKKIGEKRKAKIEQKQK
jgi:uncharacterized membrane protein YwaF